MGRSRVVRPEVAVLPLSDGDTITVKRRLTAGEELDAYARTLKEVDGRWVKDPIAAIDSALVAYLIDWTLVDPDGRLIPIRGEPFTVVRDALRALESESFFEIKAAIESHEQAMVAERAAQKKTRSGEPASPHSSPSLVGVAGATSG